MNAVELKLLAGSARPQWQALDAQERLLLALLQKMEALEEHWGRWQRLTALPPGPERDALIAEFSRLTFEFSAPIFADALKAVSEKSASWRADLLRALQALEDQAE